MTESIDQKAARLAKKVFQHLQGNMSATFGWQGNDPDGYTLALKAHNQKTIDLIAADLRTELSAPAVQGEVVLYSVIFNNQHTDNIFHSRRDAELASERLNSKFPNDVRSIVPLYTTPQPATDKLRQIIAAAYQIAGAFGASEHVLEVLADPMEATQAQIDALLPFGPAIAQPAQPIGGEVTAPALTPEMRESLNSRLSDHWYGCADDVWRLIWATATSTKPVAQEPLQEAKDSERLKFMASRPSRYVEYDRNALYRVYEDAATALAEHAEWKAMTPAYYGTANAAIDAAIASQKGSV